MVLLPVEIFWGMKRIFFQIISVAVLASVPAMAQGNEKQKEEPAQMKPKKERKIGGRAVDILYEKEIQALEQADRMMDDIKDADSAREIGLKLRQMFCNRYVPIGGEQYHLEELAKAQNKITMKMRAIRHKPYFEKTRLPEAWRFIVVPSTRYQSTSRDK